MTADLVLSIVMLAAFALLAGAFVLWRRTGDAKNPALMVVLALVAIGNVLEPRIMGRGLGISTLAIFIALLFWGWLLGSVGMFLAVPLTSALITALDASPYTRPLAILLGPAIEDSASGKSVLQGAAMRTSLFVGVALYAWATVWVLERWRARQPRAAAVDVLLKETP